MGAMIEARCHKRSQSASPAHVLCTHLPSGILESLQASSDVSENALAALSVCSIALSGRWVGWEGVGGGSCEMFQEKEHFYPKQHVWHAEECEMWAACGHASIKSIPDALS